MDDLNERLEKLSLTTVSLLTQIDNLNGQWLGGARLSPQALGRLKRSVLVTSTGASTRIEGANLADEEVEKLMRGLSMQRLVDRDAQEVRGYYEVLVTIFDSWKDIELTESNVKHLHSQLLKYSIKDERQRGEYKTIENRIVARDATGKEVSTIFETTAPYLTAKEMNELVAWTRVSLDERKYHPLLIIASFVVEFLKIHPFLDGNGRLSRILTNLPMLQAGYEYVPYVSHEKLVEDSKIGYYIALRKSQIIVDECHHIPAKTFRSVVAQLSPEFLYGLTATPKRQHNDEQLIYVYIGDIIADMSDFKDETILTPSKTFETTIRETSLAVPFNWKTDHFDLIAKIISYDTARNQQVVQDILEQVGLHRKTLVLSERKEHLKVMDLYLKGQCETLIFTGDDSAASRTSKLQQIQDGHYQVLLATGQIFGEGMHVESIEALILAFPFAFEGKLTQYVGRLMHSSNPRVLIDYHDKHIPFLNRQFRQRKRVYEKL